MPRTLIHSAAPILFFALLSACANLNTINRSTYLEDNTAKAIHLDAQQRLLIVNKMGKYCAEPSPDALAAYAAAVGLGASAPTSGSVSASGGGQSSAASIGLRTQSITLMRDALFRMCEAYANGAIGEAQVVTLLNRSQDLTAVILAVEQLTGVVAANQVALTGSSGASGFAAALNNSKLLAEATAHEERVLSRLDEAKATQASANAKHEQAEAALAKAGSALQVLEGATPKDEEKILSAKIEQTFRRNMRDSTAATLKNANARVDLYQTAYDKAQSISAEIAKTPDSSAASSSANTTGNAQLSTPVSQIALSKDATEAVSTAVKEMVLAVLKKDYVLDSCMSVITSNRLSEVPEIAVLETKTRDYCQRLVSALIEAKAILAEGLVLEIQESMIEKSSLDILRIVKCVAPISKLDTTKRDQLFDDANTDKKLLKDLVTSAKDLSSFKTMLGQNQNVRIAMAAKTASSAACK